MRIVHTHLRRKLLYLSNHSHVQVIGDELLSDDDRRSEALFLQCLQAALHAADGDTARGAAELLKRLAPPVAALKPLQLALQV